MNANLYSFPSLSISLRVIESGLPDGKADTRLTPIDIFCLLFVFCAVLNHRCFKEVCKDKVNSSSANIAVISIVKAHSFYTDDIY